MTLENLLRAFTGYQTCTIYWKDYEIAGNAQSLVAMIDDCWLDISVEKFAMENHELQIWLKED